MQVVRESRLRVMSKVAHVSITWVIYPQVRDNSGKLELIPDKPPGFSDPVGKGGLFMNAAACR